MNPFWKHFVTRLAQGRPMGIGAYLFVAHRLSGVALTVYLYIHLVTLGSVLEGPDGFDRAMAWMITTPVKLGELGLVGVVLFHALNGLRLTVLAVAPGLDHKRLAYAVVVVSIAAILMSLPYFVH